MDIDLRNVDIPQLLADTSAEMEAADIHHNRCIRLGVADDGGVWMVWTGPGGEFTVTALAKSLPMLVTD